MTYDIVRVTYRMTKHAAKDKVVYVVELRWQVGFEQLPRLHMIKKRRTLEVMMPEKDP